MAIHSILIQIPLQIFDLPGQFIFVRPGENSPYFALFPYHFIFQWKLWELEKNTSRELCHDSLSEYLHSVVIELAFIIGVLVQVFLCLPESMNPCKLWAGKTWGSNEEGLLKFNALAKNYLQFNLLTPKISLVILLTVCYTIHVILFWRIWNWINQLFPNWYFSLFSLLVYLILYW